MSLLGTAFAQVAPATTNAPKFDFLSMIPILLILIVGYFLLIRPQQKKMKQHADMISAIRRGDRVVTSSGIIGVIHKIVSNEEATVEIAENVRVRMLKSSVSQVLAKTAPVDVHSSTDDIYDDAENHTTEVSIQNSDDVIKAKKNFKPSNRPKKLPTKSE